MILEAIRSDGRFRNGPCSTKEHHALSAPIPRRAARPAAGLGRGRPAREAAQGGARVEGAVALQQGEVALVLRQRPEGLLPRLLLRQARRHLRLRDGDRGRQLPRSRGAAGRRSPAFPLPQVVAARPSAQETAPQDAARRDGARREILRGPARRPRRRQGARLSRRPRARLRHPAQVPHRLCAERALRAEGASRQPGRAGRGHGRDRAAGRRRRHPGALRPVPRPGDVSDHRCARPGDRLRRPRAREGRAGEIPELAGDPALPQGRHPLQHRQPPAAGAPMPASRWSRWRAMSTSSPW